MTRRVTLRDDARIGDDDQLLLRMNDDRDLTNGLKLALADAPAYRTVPGFELTGAVAVSCFLVATDLDAQIVVRGTRWSVYGLASVARLRALGCTLVATEVFDGEEPCLSRTATSTSSSAPTRPEQRSTPRSRGRSEASCAPASPNDSTRSCERSTLAGQRRLKPDRYHDRHGRGTRGRG